MDILVSEKATKEQVMNLADYFREEKFALRGCIINIYDSKEQYSKKEQPLPANMTEEEAFKSGEEFDKHWLVQVGRDGPSWLAIGRDH